MPEQVNERNTTILGEGDWYKKGGNQIVNEHFKIGCLKHNKIFKVLKLSSL